MRKIICALCLFLSFVNNGMSAIDDREYVDWKDYPNIVKFKAKDLNYQTLEWETFLCTGTEIGKYVITASHCVEGRAQFTIERNNGEIVKVELLSNGDSKNPETDWAILSLPTETDSKYELVENANSDFGALYGFGALRILSDEEIQKIRAYLYENNGFNADAALKLLQLDIPGIGYIYNDGDKLKMSHCSNIDLARNDIHALCVSSAGNSGGGLFINDNKIIGILSQGGYLSRDDTVFAPVKPSLNVMQKLSSESCDEEFIRDIFKTKYSNHKIQIYRINDFYVIHGSGISLLTDLCGNVLLNEFAPYAKRIISLEHKGNQYIIEETAPEMGFLVWGCDGMVQNQINKIFLERKDKINTIVYLIDDDDTYMLISLDGGKTFYKGREAMARFLFTPEEFDNMPDEWKECLEIK